MIEWIEKLPEPCIGLLASGAVWVGLNYAVLAQRAVAKDQAEIGVPRCVEVLNLHDLSKKARPSGIGSLLGIPQFDQIEREMIDRLRPAPLTSAEKEARCACAAKRAASKLRWDYALHTASFRLVSPQSIATASDEASAIVLTGVCGLLPKLRIGE